MKSPASLFAPIVASLVSLLASPTSLATPPAAPTLSEVTPSSAIAALAGTSLPYMKITSVLTYQVHKANTVQAEIPLAISVQTGTLWSVGSSKLSDYAMSQLNKTLSSFLECGVSFNPVNILFFDMTSAGSQILNNYANQDPYAGPFEIALFGDFPTSLRPMAVLSSTGIPEAFNLSSVNQYKTNQTPNIDKIANMAFVPGDSDADYYKKFQTQASFSILAHELTHITGNLAHIPTSTPNLMSNTTGQIQSGDLNAAQCAAILANRL